MNVDLEDPLAADTAHGQPENDSGNSPFGKRAAQTLREQRQQMVTDAKQAACSFAVKQKQDVATLLGDFAAAVDAFTTVLNDRGRIRAAGYAGTAGERLRSFSEDLPQRDLGDVIVDVETFARERPVTFVSAMLVAGFAAARFLRVAAAEDAAGGDDRVGLAGTTY